MPILGVIASSHYTNPTPPDLGAMFPLGMVYVGSSGAATISFTGIPATYKHLQIRIFGRTTSSVVPDAITLQYNGDTGANYTYHSILGNGTTTVAFGAASQNSNYLDKLAGASTSSGVFGSIIGDVFDYSSTTKYKTVRSLGGLDNNGSGVIHLSSGLWLNTNAVTSLVMTPAQGGNFAQFTSIALYGIKGA
jgi:hypothetical protein